MTKSSPHTTEDRHGDSYLWCAVILQTLEEACGNVKGATGPKSAGFKRKIINEARTWLTKPSADFSEVCRLAGLEPDAVRERAMMLIDASGPVSEQSVTKPRRPRAQRAKEPRLLTFNGETLLISEWSKRTGISTRTINSRLTYGWSVEQTLTEPVARRARAPGVGKNFAASKGTGGGSTTQVST